MLKIMLKPEKYKLESLYKRFVLAKLILVILRVTLNRRRGLPEILGGFV
jgi:hypothetical protein